MKVAIIILILSLAFVGGSAYSAEKILF